MNAKKINIYFFEKKLFVELLIVSVRIYLESLVRKNAALESGNITRKGFRVTSVLIFWYVTLEAKWYMYNVMWYL